MDPKDKTRLVHLARDHMKVEHAAGRAASVNPPLVRASTALYPGTAGMLDIRARNDAGEQVFRYGARGTSTTFALENAITAIEGGERTMLFPTGLAAIAHPFLSILRPGDHLLLAETVYGPARALAEKYLPQRGIACEFYKGGHQEMAARLTPKTRMVYLDNPGSIVYDIQDLPALAAALKGRETLLAVDNTWGAPGLYKPLALGADISIIAVTKYIAGHSDLVMGSVTGNARCARQLWDDAALLGQTVSPDDAFQALKGLRTAAARLAMIEKHARAVIAWLQQRPEVERVLWPALETDPGHALWKRDFKGANGLFSIGLKAGIDQKAVYRFIDALKLFGIGASWGGFESLVLTYGRVPGWSGNQLIRFHVGLEDPSDIIADLERGFAAMAAA
ncbi:MAG: cystathionine beta-lyase [Hyphomicrobiaceae bacterium]